MTTDTFHVGLREPAQPQLGSWVEIHDEPCRGGSRRHQLLVNHRTKVVLRLTNVETELCHQLQQGKSDSFDQSRVSFVEELRVQGFLVGEESEPSPDYSDDQRRPSFASTLDVRWKGANRLICFIYRKGARHLFHPIAVVGQVVLALAGLAAVIIAACAHGGLHLRVTPVQIPWIIGMSLVAVAVHELAHALVLVHCNRTVDAVGMRMFLGTPSFYVESVDALLLTRRQRMVQAAAGPWAEWLVVSVAAIWLWQSPLIVAVPLVHRFVLLNAATIGSNLLPFAGLDGSWLLADAVAEPDLGQRSRSSISRLVTRAFTKTPISTDDWGLAIYSLANSVVAGLLVATSAFFWYQLFGNLLDDLFHRGVGGWLVLTCAAFVLGRPIVRALLPRILAGIDTMSTLRDLAVFRMQWSWRIAAIKALAAAADELAEVSEAGLGVLAGQLCRTRTRRRGRDLSGSYALIRSSCATSSDDPVGIKILSSNSDAYRPRHRVICRNRRAVLITLDLKAVEQVLAPL